MKFFVPILTSGGLAAVSSSAFAALYSAFGKYDVVHIHAEGPAFFCWLPKLFGKRVVVTIHGIDWQREKWQSGLGSKFIHQGEKNAVKYADEVIVLSKGVDRLCGYPLLVIDDFGMERGTEYVLEQIYNIIDSRYRSRKPLIVTTNLTLTELKNPQNTAHARIYDRLLELCTPIACTGPSMRKDIGQAKLNLLKALLA